MFGHALKLWRASPQWIVVLVSHFQAETSRGRRFYLKRKPEDLRLERHIALSGQSQSVSGLSSFYNVKALYLGRKVEGMIRGDLECELHPTSNIHQMSLTPKKESQTAAIDEVGHCPLAFSSCFLYILQVTNHSHASTTFLEDKHRRTSSNHSTTGG